MGPIDTNPEDTLLMYNLKKCIIFRGAIDWICRLSCQTFLKALLMYNKTTLMDYFLLTVVGNGEITLTCWSVIECFLKKQNCSLQQVMGGGQQSFNQQREDARCNWGKSTTSTEWEVPLSSRQSRNLCYFTLLIYALSFPLSITNSSLLYSRKFSWFYILIQYYLFLFKYYKSE